MTRTTDKRKTIEMRSALQKKLYCAQPREAEGGAIFFANSGRSSLLSDRKRENPTSGTIFRSSTLRRYGPSESPSRREADGSRTRILTNRSNDERDYCENSEKSDRAITSIFAVAPAAPCHLGDTGEGGKMSESRIPKSFKREYACYSRDAKCGIRGRFQRP